MNLETRILELENKVIELQDSMGEYKQLINQEPSKTLDMSTAREMPHNDPDKLLSKIKRTVVGPILPQPRVRWSGSGAASAPKPETGF